MPTGWDRQTTPTEKNNKNLETIPTQTNETFSSAETEISRMEMFVPEEPNRCFDDLILPISVKERLKAALNRIQFHDILYHQWNLKSVDPRGTRIAINFFGSPGTGKTFCAETIAEHLKKKIIRVNYAEIESKYVGETPKNITAAFNKAKETDSVLFFDEADSILGKRLTNVTQSADHGVNVSRSVMLLQLDKFDGVVIFASNLAKNYDEAFVRRILAHIEFELPDQECRIKLWNYLLPKEIPREEDVNFEWLANESNALSGGDILNVVIASASRAVQRTGDNQKVFRYDFAEEIHWVRVAKEKVGSSSSTEKQLQIKETVMRPDELSPELLEKYEKIVPTNNIASEN
jgi:SpoVK/Ycf46/Vps4 family AAA+-type ATPase